MTSLSRTHNSALLITAKFFLSCNMLRLYQPSVRILCHRLHVGHNPIHVASGKRFSSVNQTTNKRLTSNDFERRIAVSMPRGQNILVTQRPRQAAYACRYFSDESGKMTQAEIKMAIQTISEKFTEAMELMNDARASAGTVYFSEDLEDTHAQVTETLEDYTTLLAKLNESQKMDVIQSIGLKMEELKVQISLLDDLVKSEKPFV